MRVCGLYNKHWHFELRKTRHGFNNSQLIEWKTYGPSYCRILRLDRDSVRDWYLSNDLQIRISAISLFNAKEIKTLNRLLIWNSQNCSMFPLAFVAGSFQGYWWGFISRNYVVWPIFFLMNVFIALELIFLLFTNTCIKNINVLHIYKS